MADNEQSLTLAFKGDSTSYEAAVARNVAASEKQVVAERNLKAAVSETSKEIQKSADVSSGSASAAKTEALLAMERQRVEVAKLMAMGQTKAAEALERQYRASRELQAAQTRGGSGLADLVAQRQALESSIPKEAGEMGERGVLRTERAVSGLIRDLSTTGNLFDALATSAERFGRVAEVGLGLAVAVAAGVSLKDAIEESAKEMDHLQTVGQKVFEQRTNTPFRDKGEITGGIKEAESAIEEFQKAYNSLDDSRLAKIKYDLIAIFSGHALTDNAAKALTDLSGAIDALGGVKEQGISDLAKKEGEVASMARLTAMGYGAEAEQIKRQIAYKEELGKLSGEEYRDVRENLQARQRAEEDLFQKEKQHTADLVELEHTKLINDQQGNYAEMENARAELTQRLKEQRETRYGTPEKDVADNAVLKAETALANAARAAGIKSRSEADALAIAKEVASADQKHLEALVKQGAELKKQREEIGIGRDKTGPLDVQIAQNAAAQDAMRRAQSDASYKSLDNAADRNSGYGPSEEIRLAERKLEIEKQLNESHESDINYSNLEVDNERTKISSDEKSLALRKATFAVSEADYTAQGNILTIQGSNSSETSKRYQITQQQLAAVQAEITAMGSLNSELAKAAQLRAQGLSNDLHAQDQANNFGKSERQINNRLRGDADRTRKLDKWQSNRNQPGGDLINKHRDMDGNIIGGNNPNTGDHEDVAPPDSLDPKNFKPGIDDAGALEPRMRGERAAGDKAFGDQFKTNAQRAAEKAAQQQNQAATDKADNKKSGDSAEVSELKEIKAKLDKIALT